MQTATITAILGAGELWPIAIVLLVLFGGSQLPKLARSLGQAQSELKKGMEEGAADEESEEKA